MSVSYTTVQWNRHKRTYDLAIALAVVLFVLVYVVMTKLTLPSGREAIGEEVLIIRALAGASMVLLHIVLVIGPLARLHRRFGVLLYNRRHLGVITFLVGAAHALLATGYYGGFGVRNPASAMLDYPTTFARVSAWPFEWFGLFALAVMFVMASTSHDFWLRNLSARWWKRLHLCVYLAYGALVLHVALGAMQAEPSGYYPMVLLAGVAVVGGLHIAAGLKELAADRRTVGPDADGWVDVAGVNEIEPTRAKVVSVRGCAERVAVFRVGEGTGESVGGFAALASVCAHQGGPLGEGQVLDGCATCPWHGYQYEPGTGCSPPPFDQTVPRYEVRIQGGRVLVKADRAIEPVTARTGAARANSGGQSA